MSNMEPSNQGDHSLSQASSLRHRSSGTSNHQRVLACTSCQQRKVKCDRNFPCSNCVKYRLQCVQATLAQRKRRFSERALLERVRKYEGLLRRHKIAFEPLHSPRREDSFNADASEDSQDEQMNHVAHKAAHSPIHEKGGPIYEPKCVSHHMRQKMMCRMSNLCLGTYSTP